MKILIFFGVYAAETDFAEITLKQIATLSSYHEVHLLILDDASHNFLGLQLKARVEGLFSGEVEVIRLPRSGGYYGAIDRTVEAFRYIVEQGKGYDYVLRLDADLYFCRRDLESLFSPSRLPLTGIVGPLLTMRPRDFTLFLADMVPFGWRRRKVNGCLTHCWELKRSAAVWWSDIGGLALRSGFRGDFIPGCFQIIAFQTLSKIHARGYLKRDRKSWGLVFGEDVITNTMVRAVGDPVIDIKSIVPDFACEIFLSENTSLEWIHQHQFYFIHPLKGQHWAQQIRQNLMFNSAISQSLVTTSPTKY